MESYLSIVQDPVFQYFMHTCNFISLVCWIASLITDNYSQVDRLWSILPPVYAWGFLFTAIHFCPTSITSELNTSILKSDFSSRIRLFIIVVLVTLWGARLTYNFWRKGGYNQGEEDYRWVQVRKLAIFNYPQQKVLFHIFSFVFVAFIQNWLLLGLVSPMWFIQTNRTSELSRAQEPFNVLDVLVTVFCVGAFLTEIIADQQQFRFQTRKQQWLAEKRSGQMIGNEYDVDELADFERGFLTRGLFKYSRHPNFFGEISIWWCIYAFSISSQYSSLKRNFALSRLFNCSSLAVIFLTLLFQGSTWLTEKISADKYSKYKEYQTKCSRIIPWTSDKMDKLN